MGAIRCAGWEGLEGEIRKEEGREEGKRGGKMEEQLGYHRNLESERIIRK